MPAQLTAEMQDHLSEAFPASVERGAKYGEVDAVMIGADIYGWATRVASGVRLDPSARADLSQAANALDRSLPEFPADARPYYERVLRIARLALDAE